MAVIGPQYGCTDPNATNYNSSATIDDGSCTYTPTPPVPPSWHVDTMGITVSFSEVAKGWTSFKSFVQDNGLSLNNDYYTFKNTNVVDTNGNITSSDFMLWKHHNNEVRNNFYGQQYDSHVDVLFNEESATVKSFTSMKYEGSQSKITEDITDPAYFNNEERKGWYVESGLTDLQLAGEMEFKNKEGKWFSYMKGRPVEDYKDLNSREFSFQGIDILIDQSTSGNVFGCTDPTATNYDPLATDDDGSCIYPPYSCWSCQMNDLGTGLECIEDTDPLNAPCVGFSDKGECEQITNYCTGPPPSLYTLTINDSTPLQQQMNYSVSTFTKTGIVGDSVIPPVGTGTGNILTGGSEYMLEISADAGYTVRARDFAIEFPSGTAGTHWLAGGGTQIPFKIFMDEFFGAGSALGLGQGNDLGTGPLVSRVTFQDSENPNHLPTSVAFTPTGSNKVLVKCDIETDMQDNIPGNPNYPANNEVYMTHNGMQSTNSINPGIPGDLNTFINIIGSAEQPLSGCTDITAINYNSAATVDDGSCSYGGCTDPVATNYNSAATIDDGSCAYAAVYGCTDNTQGLAVNWVSTDNRPEGYFGAAVNYNPSATASCDGGVGQPPCIPSNSIYSHITGMQSGVNCCCEYDGCNEIVQSLEGTLSITHSASAAGNSGEMTYTISNGYGGSVWIPPNNDITINIYDGHSSTYVSNMQTNMFWNSSSNASGWGGMGANYAVSSSSQQVVHTANSGANPTTWNHVGPTTTVNGLGLPVGDYHMRVDTSDSCFLWYDFTIENSYAPNPNVYGCTDPVACNYNPLATIDDGSCTYSGCTDPIAANYNPLAGCDDGSCGFACTDYGLTGIYVDNVVSGGFDFHYDDMNGAPCSGISNCWQDCCVNWIKVIWTECDSSPPYSHVSTPFNPSSITNVVKTLGGGVSSCWGSWSCSNNNCQQGFTNCEDSGCTGGTCTKTFSNISTTSFLGLHPGLTYHIRAQIRYACYPAPTSNIHVGYITMPGTDPSNCNVHSSDRRLKKNINKIGESPSGLNIYSFEYKNSKYGEGLFQGVMSDEIPQEAVGTRDGYDTVNYNMLDVEFKQI